MKKYKKDREALKLELKFLLETEDLAFMENQIKEYYQDSHRVTYKLAISLLKLDIPLRKRPNEDADPWDWYYDIMEDFVEKVVHPPEGWQWYDNLIEKK